MSQTEPTARPVVLVTGPSGAGRSSALNVLEDAGFEVIDNLPLRLLPRLLDASDDQRALGLGVDPRNRDFSTNGVTDTLGWLTRQSGVAPELLYLDCRTEVLLRRYSETRRRHPLAPDDRPSEGITRELEMLRPLRARADVLIDTSDLTVHELRAEIEQWFAPGGQRRLTVSVQSFSYKRGLPRSVDSIYDCRFLRNPYWSPALRVHNGTEPAVAAFVKKDACFEGFSTKVKELSLFLLPAYREEGKSNFTIAFGCTGGQHRSVVMAELHGLQLAEAGWQVSIRHRELDRRKKEETGP
ncbi:MAG: RNase adapter RapZ [Pseudomonadota bacterium]